MVFFMFKWYAYKGKYGERTMEQAPLLDRFRWVILSVVGLIIAAVFGYFLLDQDEPVSIVIQPPPPTATLTPLPSLEVYVTGAVANPQSRFSLPPGARVEDAIEAAGGAANDADLTLVNLAKPLQDGEQIHIPRQGEQAIIPIESGAAGLLDLNTATVEQLDELPGIGPSTAQAIVDYRTQHGGFTSVEELDNVSGIGPATLEQIRPLVTVGESQVIAATATPVPIPTATNTPESSLININTAPLEALDSLPGIGPSTAQAIIDYRTENGDFTSVDELDNVSGIGPAILENIRDLVTVGEIPATAETTATASPSSESTKEAKLIDINTAAVEELDALPGIGPSLAQEIVDFRTENGLFRSVDELENVPGIGSALLEDIRDLVMVDTALVYSQSTKVLPAQPSPTPSATSDKPPIVNINTATLEELDQLPGIGPTTAQAIIDYRERFGPFTSIEQLNSVPGIGRRTIDQIRNYVTVE